MAVTNKLKTNHEFNMVYRRGKKYTSKTVYANIFRRYKNKEIRVGYAVVRGNGGSVRRNRLKRLLREASRDYLSQCIGGYDIIFTAKAPEKLPEYREIKRDIKYLLRISGLSESPEAKHGIEG